MTRRAKIPFPVWRGYGANADKVRCVYLSNFDNRGQFDSAGFYDELEVMLADEGVIYEFEYVQAWCRDVLFRSPFVIFD